MPAGRQRRRQNHADAGTGRLSEALSGQGEAGKGSAALYAAPERTVAVCGRYGGEGAAGQCRTGQSQGHADGGKAGADTAAIAASLRPVRRRDPASCGRQAAAAGGHGAAAGRAHQGAGRLCQGRAGAAAAGTVPGGRVYSGGDPRCGVCRPVCHRLRPDV